MTRDHFFQLIHTNLGVEPEYLWAVNPNYAVLRHPGSKKWFAAILDLSPAKLGLPGEGLVDVLNLRCGPALAGSLLSQDGFYPAYHMNKSHWISLCLDGKVSRDEIYYLLNESYNLTKK